ncbi:transcription factor TGA2 isoform X4 [Spinacia oleracea]|uniref:Transcription factor TGA2 isoform X4 n=1 Tax=Spinacia oleracea TaxID=3562 RepID=A0ABM3RLV7_SPIOL|nr:transcription factor TGA2-like isoform X4 [Spinacia oleracea]
MQSFRELYCHPSDPTYFFRGEESITPNIGELYHQVVFHQQDAVDLSRSGLRSSNVAFPSSLPFQAVNPNNYLGPSATAATVATTRVVEAGELVGEKRTVGGRELEYWGESATMADTSQQTDTSTDVDTDDRNQCQVIQNGAVVDSTDQSKGKTDDQKTLRRLAQNREAAKKSRLRKKAYVEQLESSRVKLAQLEQQLERARQQGFMVTGVGNEPGHSLGTNGVVAFDVHYGVWLDQHQRLINDTRSALKSHTPAERCFMWLGGFRSSELLKILVNHLQPLTEQQLMGVCNLQQSSQQAEDALSQGMEALQQSLVDTLSANCLGPCSTGIVADYMGQMAIAMGKLATLENFVHQADLLRQQTLQQLHRILTTRQAAQALLVIHDYTARLRALSSLWLARPKNCNA